MTCRNSKLSICSLQCNTSCQHVQNALQQSMQVKTTDGLPHEMQIGTSFNSRECHGSIYVCPTQIVHTADTKVGCLLYPCCCCCCCWCYRLALKYLHLQRFLCRTRWHSTYKVRSRPYIYTLHPEHRIAGTGVGPKCSAAHESSDPEETPSRKPLWHV